MFINTAWWLTWNRENIEQLFQAITKFDLMTLRTSNPLDQ